jgi:hypothetical protein
MLHEAAFVCCIYLLHKQGERRSSVSIRVLSLELSDIVSSAWPPY